MINQLFSIVPDLEFIIKILNILGLNDLNDKQEIYSSKLNIQNVGNQFKNLKIEFQKYYIKCKHNLYLNKWNTKSCITITRQILRTIDYDLLAKEKMINNIKVMSYRLITKNEKDNLKNNKNNINNKIVSFD